MTKTPAPPHRLSKLVIALALLDTVVFAILLTALLWRAVPDQNRELVAAACGFVAGWVTAMRNYLTGSTVGSEAKSQALAAKNSQVEQLDVQADTVTVEPKP